MYRLFRQLFLSGLISAVCSVCGATGSQALERTVGLLQNDPGAHSGYILFSPVAYPKTYLIDNEGYLVHSWPALEPARMSAFLREDGLLLRTGLSGLQYGMNGGGAGGRITLVEWDGTISWNYLCTGPTFRQHHEVIPMPNGNVLAICWEKISAAEALAAGRDSTLLVDGELWSEILLEIEPAGDTAGDIVWQWRIWDHLIQAYDPAAPNYGDPAEHPERIDLNFTARPRADWLHFNSVDYNPALDQILVSANRFGEVWIIDHNTTIEEAAGPAGDLLYRWGNPLAYGRGAPEDRRLFHAHDARWVPDGHPGAGDIMIFNNGRNRPDGQYSSIEQITPPLNGSGRYDLEPDSTYGPSDVTWRYTAPTPEDFNAGFMSGAQRLPGGGTLICAGPLGELFEIDTANETNWRYLNPVRPTGPVAQGDTIPVANNSSDNSVFKVTHYLPDFPGLSDKDLSRKGTIELYPTTIADESAPLPTQFELEQNYPNPFNPTTAIDFTLPHSEHVILDVYNIRGQRIATLTDQRIPAGRHRVVWDASGLSSGVYLYRLTAGPFRSSRKMTLLK